MAYWLMQGEPFRYEGGADPSATVDYGFKFMFREKTTGEEVKVNVEAASGAGEMMTPGNAHDAIVKYMYDDELPRRIVMDRDGEFYRSDD